MNYQSFSDIFRALMSAEAVAIKIQDQDLQMKTELAKAGVLKQFEAFFPSSVEDVVKRPKFDSRPFFKIISDFPFIIKGKEEKFLKFVVSLSQFNKSHNLPQMSLDISTAKIIASSVIDDYLWRVIMKNIKKDSIFLDAVEAILPFLSPQALDKWEQDFVEMVLPAWEQAFPEIAVTRKKIAVFHNVHSPSECWV